MPPEPHAHPSLLSLLSLLSQGAKSCDHMHDGNGFLTQHVALSSVFERSLQAVDRSVALPYWDFTIDSQAIIDAGDSTSTSTSTSLKTLFYGSDAFPIFTEDWFGAADKDTGVVSSSAASGHWAEAAVVPTTKTSALDSTDPSSHNSYGLLRSPWNNLKSPRVTRFFGTCGANVAIGSSSSSTTTTAVDDDATSSLSFPACAEHYSAVRNTGTYASLEEPASSSWAIKVQGDAHGPVHMFLGGTSSACADAYDVLVSECGLAAEVVDEWRLTAFGALKTLWRSGLVAMEDYCAADAAEEDCSYSCPTIDDDVAAELASSTAAAAAAAAVSDGESGVGKYLAALSPFGMLDEALAATVSAMSAQQRTCTAKALCSANVVTGDHIEAASPFDLSFWPVSDYEGIKTNLLGAWNVITSSIRAFAAPLSNNQQLYSLFPTGAPHARAPLHVQEPRGPVRGLVVVVVRAHGRAAAAVGLLRPRARRRRAEQPRRRRPSFHTGRAAAGTAALRRRHQRRCARHARQRLVVVLLLQ
jgi:hypothetical protein